MVYSIYRCCCIHDCYKKELICHKCIFNHINIQLILHFINLQVSKHITQFLKTYEWMKQSAQKSQQIFVKILFSHLIKNCDLRTSYAAVYICRQSLQIVDNLYWYICRIFTSVEKLQTIFTSVDRLQTIFTDCRQLGDKVGMGLSSLQI